MATLGSFSPATLVHVIAHAGTDMATQSNTPPIVCTFAISQSFLAHRILARLSIEAGQDVPFFPRMSVGKALQNLVL
jgi:hypothetical protein